MPSTANRRRSAQAPPAACLHASTTQPHKGKHMFEEFDAPSVDAGPDWTCNSWGNFAHAAVPRPATAG